MIFKEKLPFFLPLIFSLFIIYYPIFFGFLISPNDIYLHYDPFRYGSFKYSSLNPTLNDPATAYWTKGYLFKTEPESLFFNPYIASGMPGALDLFSGILNPFVLIPLIFPIELFFSLMILLKIIISYTGMYLFLKNLNLNNWACSFGAVSYSLFAQNVLWALWPQTNVSSLFPWFFYGLKIKNSGLRFFLFFLLFVFSITGGYPPYFIAFSLFFFLYLVLVEIKDIINKIKKLILPVLLSAVFLLPLLYLTYYDLKESGRLELRENLAEKEEPFPLKQLFLFFSPYKFGTPQNFSLKSNEGFYSFCLYFGIFGLIFLPLGLFTFNNSCKRFFIISVLFFILIFYLNSPLRKLVCKMPGISYSSFSRISIIFGFSLCIVSAFGFDKFLNLLKNKKFFILIPIIASIELGFFASKFFSYQEIKSIKPKDTPAISFLREKLKEGPFRVCGLYDSLWPNSCEYTKIPDIRSHFSSEKWYRDFLSLADPNVSKRMGTFLLFWDATSIESPIFSSLFVKYITEPPFINTIEPIILSKTYIENPNEYVNLPSSGLKRTVHFSGTPYSIELHLKEVKSKVYLNIYDDFAKNLLEKYEVYEFDGRYWVLIERPWEFSFSRVILEVISEKDLKVGKTSEGFSLNISYSPYFKVYDGNDLKIFENRCVFEPFILTFEGKQGFNEREEDLHYFSYFSNDDFKEIDNFLNKTKKKYKNGKVSCLKLDLYGGDFKISTNANSVLVLPFKYNNLFAEAVLDGEKTKIYKVNGAVSGILIPEGEHILNFNFGKKFIFYIFISLFILILTIIIFLLIQ